MIRNALSDKDFDPRVHAHQRMADDLDRICHFIACGAARQRELSV